MPPTLQQGDTTLKPVQLIPKGFVCNKLISGRKISEGTANPGSLGKWPLQGGFEMATLELHTVTELNKTGLSSASYVS